MIIEIRAPRMSRICRSDADSRSIPSNSMRRASIRPLRAVRRSRARPVWDLPDPDSPTIPSRSRPSSNETPRTASTGPRGVVKVTTQVLDGQQRAHDAGTLRVQHVAQAVAQQAEAQRDDEDRGPRDGRHPPFVQQEIAARGDHRAPFRGRRLRAQAQEAQPRGRQDDPGHVQRQPHDDRGEAERHDVPAQDAEGRRPLCLGRQDVLGIADRQHLGPRDPGIGDQVVSAMASTAFSSPGPSAATSASARIRRGRPGRCR